MRTLHQQMFSLLELSQLKSQKPDITTFAQVVIDSKTQAHKKVTAQDQDGQMPSLDFDIADKVAQQLASVHSIAQKSNATVFEEDGGYILHKASTKRTPLRLEGKLYYLDLWVQAPEDIAKASPFVGRPKRHGLHGPSVVFRKTARTFLGSAVGGWL